MKKYLFMAMAAVAFASCANEDAIVSDAPVAAEGDVAVSFGAYTTGQSRSTIETFKTTAQNGFGVFAFSQMQEKIDKYSKANFMPNFMFNQKVSNPTANSYGEGAWTYSPIKYWPNNPGALVSFYAYAPYFEEFNKDSIIFTPESNDYMNEITTIKEKNVRLLLGYDAMGPAIQYARSSVATEGVDLMWGEYIKEPKSAATDSTGKAAVDLQKLPVSEKIMFQFHHAMSRLHFNVQVWPDTVPVTSEDVKNASDSIAENTTIYIRKVELVGNFANKGSLRLYDGKWAVEQGDVSNLVFEGEDQLAANIIAGLKGKDAQKEIDLLVGSSMEDGKMKEDSLINNFVMVIPGVKCYIQITYDVVTVDPANPKNNSTVTNVIKSTDTNATADGSTDGWYTLEQGKAYNFHLNLGMTTVKFDADVTPWDVNTYEIALPENVSTTTTEP